MVNNKVDKKEYKKILKLYYTNKKQLVEYLLSKIEKPFTKN